MTPGEWFKSGEYISCHGHRLFFRQNRRPHKPGLLLLHGFPTASWDWYKMWPLLDAHFHLIAPDFLGFGFSDKPYPFPYNIHFQADLIEDLLRQVNWDQGYLIAHDYAVSVAQELLWRSLKNKETTKAPFKKIILLNGGLFPETHIARPIQKWLLGPFGKYVNRLLSKSSLRRNLKQVFGPNTPPSADEIDAFWYLINYNKGKRCFHLLIRYMQDRLDHREAWLRALQETQVPVRLINGPEDPVSGRHMTHRYRELIREPDIVLLDGIGHYPNVEAPEKVCRNVLGYFV